MRKNAGLKSREEMSDYLKEGNTLYHGADKLYFDSKEIFIGKSPYKLEYASGYKEAIFRLWDRFAEMEVEVRCEEELKHRNILCWVSDINKAPDSTNRLMLVIKYSNDNPYPYECDVINYKYATPLTEEAKQICL